MTQLSLRPLQPFAKTAVASRSMTMDPVAKMRAAALGQHDLMIVTAFCAIGLVLSFAVLAQVPELSDAIGQISLLP